MEPIQMKIAAKDYLARNINPTLLRGLTEVCKQKPKDPVVSPSNFYQNLAKVI